jgi:hypothetical protein
MIVASNKKLTLWCGTKMQNSDHNENSTNI